MSVHPDGSRLPGASDIESGVMDASRKGMSAADVGKDAAAGLGEAAKASAGLSYARFRALIRWVALVLLWLIVVCLILGSSRQFLSITSYEPGADGLPPVITIDMKAKDTSSQWPFAPAGFADATDHCNVLITNPCKAPYMQPYREGCEEASFVGFGFAVNQETSTPQKLVIEMKPERLWQFLPTTWNNEDWCNLLVVVPENVDIIINAHKATIVAEHVLLRSLTVNTNGGSIWLQTKNLTVSESLTVHGTSGGVLMEDFNMPSGKVADVSMDLGSIDITTSSSPQLEVKTSNKAVCLVGAFDVPPTRSDLLVGNLTFSTHVATMSCTSVRECRKPLWKIRTGGTMGSIGIHAYTLNPATPLVFTGEAFTDGYFAKIEADSKIKFGLVSVTGLGHMRAGLQMILANKRIWLAFGDLSPYYLQLYAFFSWFTVMPIVSDHQATISFCPAHGFPTVRGKKDLLTPMKSLMAQSRAPLDENQNLYMIFRNLGGARDGMQPKDYTKKINTVRAWVWRDKLVPDCDYCSDQMYWKSTQFVGSFKALTGKCEGFPGETGCMTYVTQRANSFTLHPKGDDAGGSCFGGDEVATLMSDQVSFSKFLNISRTSDITMTPPDDESTCVTSADFIAFVSGSLLQNYFLNGSADLAMYLSWLIGAVAAVFFTRAIYVVIYKASRTNYIASLILLNPGALADLTRCFAESKQFAIVTDDSEVDKQPLTKEGARVVQSLAMDRIPVKPSRFSMFSGKLCATAKKRGKAAPKTKPVQIADLATTRWVMKSMALARLEPQDQNGSVQGIWDFQENRVAGDARVVFLHQGPMNGSPEQLDWNATIPGSTKRVGQRFKEMQRDVHNITYLVQRLHIELSVYFFISSSAKDTNADDDETAANKPEGPSKGKDTSASVGIEMMPSGTLSKGYPSYWTTIGKEIERWTVPNTFKGEAQTILLTFIIQFLPILTLNCWVVNIYYSALREKGRAVFGVGSDMAAFQETTVWSVLFFCAFSHVFVAGFYFLRTRSWWLPKEKGWLPEQWYVHADMKKPWYSFGRDAGTWYIWHSRVQKFAVVMVFGLQNLAMIWMFVVSAVWVLLGMFLEPAKVAPYASAILGLVGHISSLALGMKDFLNDCKLQLKVAIEEFENKLKSQALEEMTALNITSSLGGIAEEAKNAAAAAKVAMITSARVKLEPKLVEMGLLWQDVLAAIHNLTLEDLEEGARNPDTLAQKLLPIAKQAVFGATRDELEPKFELAGLGWDNALSIIDNLTLEELQQGVSDPDTLIQKMLPLAQNATSGLARDAAAGMHGHVQGHLAPHQNEIKRKESDMKKRKEAAQKKMNDLFGVAREVNVHEIEMRLAKFGISTQDIVVTVGMSAALLCLVLLFLFIGMSAFSEGDPDAAQSAINSLITGGAAVATNLASSGEGSQKLKKIIDKAIEEYKKTRTRATLSFGMDEDISKVVDRAVKVNEDALNE